MEPLTFGELAGLLQYSKTTRIDPMPVREEQGRWSLYRGEHRVHTKSLPFSVLYLLADATKASVEHALRDSRVYETGHTQLVFAASLRQQRWFNEVTRFVDEKWTTRDYLASFIKDELDAYLQRLKERDPRYFIDPRVETPSGFVRKRPNPVLSLLLDPDPGCGQRDGMLGVLLAEPGQGKTYMSQRLVAELASKSRYIPIYINAAQWDTLAPDHLRSLPKTITHSFRYYDATIPWLDGHEDLFLRVALKAELFRVVFDGFDEYVLWNQGRVDAVDTLDALSELAASTGSRVVITSRTSFWETQIAEEAVRDFIARTGSGIYKILPFDLQHAENYFTNRFGADSPTRTRAVSAFRSLRQSDEDLAGRGFFLNLLADLAERSTGDLTVAQTSRAGAMAWVVRSLCERETLRQLLPVSPDEQVQILRRFATEAMREPELASTEFLELLAADEVHRLDEPARRQLIEKFASHPLIGLRPDGKSWYWHQEQVELALVAEQVLHWVGSGGSGELAAFFSRSRLTAGRLADLSTMCVDLCQAEGRDQGSSLSRELCRLLLQSDDLGPRTFAVSVAVAAVDRWLPQGSSRQERAQCFVSMLEGSPIRRIRFTGGIARMDFSGIQFEHCRFDRVLWANCDFDRATRFSHCMFFGGGLASSRGFGDAELSDDCTLDPDAQVWINGARVTAGRRLYTEADLRADLRAALVKFIIKGGTGLKTVEHQHLVRGVIAGSKYSREIVEELKTLVIEDHAISGSARGGYNVRPSAEDAMKFFATNNVFTGPLSLLFDRLKTRLRIS